MFFQIFMTFLYHKGGSLHSFYFQPTLLQCIHAPFLSEHAGRSLPVHASCMNIVPNTPLTQKTKRALGNKAPNDRKSSSELIRRAYVHAMRILHNLCRVARIHAPQVAQRIAAADSEVDARAHRASHTSLSVTVSMTEVFFSSKFCVQQESLRPGNL